MPGGLPRKDQRAAGELYVRGLLGDGQRKSMQPMAARLGIDHQRLQQFITSSTRDYAAVRRNVARWFASARPVDALVIDDNGFPKDGGSSPCVARQYSGTLGGEPLIDPLFAETHAAAWDMGMMIQISSNVSRLDQPRTLDLLTARPPYRLTLSIYGAPKSPTTG
jgi:SRSO17 transposase